MQVVKGHIYHLHITFPDGSLVNQFIAQGWGFTASLFTYKRKRGHINVSPSRAVTQIRAKSVSRLSVRVTRDVRDLTCLCVFLFLSYACSWLDVVEPDPDVEELEAGRQAKRQDEIVRCAFAVRQPTRVADSLTMILLSSAG